MKIAITGNGGFLGKYTVDCLRVKNELKLFNRKKHDLFTPKTLKSFVSGQDVIIHLAGANRDIDSNIIKTNTYGTACLLEAIAAYNPGVRIILSSSSQVYSNSLYGLSKFFAEELIKNYSEKKLVEGIVLRFTNIFGTGAKPFYNSAIATFIHLAKKGESIKLNGDGSQRRDFIFVTDAAAAIEKACYYEMNKPFVTFDICSGKPISLKRVLHEIGKIKGKELDIIYTEEKPEDKQIFKTNNAAIKKLDWRQHVSFPEGLKKYYDKA